MLHLHTHSRNKTHSVFLWITNRCIKISSEEFLYLSGDTDLLRSHEWQFCPQLTRLVAHKVRLLIAASSRILLGNSRRLLKAWLWRLIIVSLWKNATNREQNMSNCYCYQSPTVDIHRRSA